jgi:putative selenate reductase FAD-binding subunit
MSIIKASSIRGEAMITQYFRPNTLEEALRLLKHPDTYPLGGGTDLSQRTDSFFSVVDLQALGLDTFHQTGNNLDIGGTVTLQSLLESTITPEALKKAIELEAPLNLRTMGTVAGSLVTCDGRSPFGVSMLALDAQMTLLPGNEQISLGNYLPFRGGGEGFHTGRLITKIAIPLGIKLAFETVARTPADKPIICAALAQWPSGRTRLALGGWGHTPTLVVDGNEASGLKEAAQSACAEAGDEWASGEYRMEVVGILTKRCQDALEISRE